MIAVCCTLGSVVFFLILIALTEKKLNKGIASHTSEINTYEIPFSDIQKQARERRFGISNSGTSMDDNSIYQIPYEWIGIK